MNQLFPNQAPINSPYMSINSSFPDHVSYGVCGGNRYVNVNGYTAPLEPWGRPDPAFRVNDTPKSLPRPLVNREMLDRYAGSKERLFPIYQPLNIPEIKPFNSMATEPSLSLTNLTSPLYKASTFTPKIKKETVFDYASYIKNLEE